MRCLKCGDEESKVIDSRPTEDGMAIRRRRECIECGYRFTTYEKIENIPIMVVKKNGMREAFNRDKIINGILRACEKRPVSMDKIEKIADEIEEHINNSLMREIKTEDIGNIVSHKLKEIDDIAYVRFASVYKQFKDINEFKEELNKILK
jgi:transcriptional repressor NrdR